MYLVTKIGSKMNVSYPSEDGSKSCQYDDDGRESRTGMICLPSHLFSWQRMRELFGLIFTWCCYKWRYNAYGKCAHHNSSDWVRSAIASMGRGPNGLDSWASDSAHILACYMVCIHFAGWLLPESQHWQETLHLPWGCKIYSR